jgi:hypothetical protein
MANGFFMFGGLSMLLGAMMRGNTSTFFVVIGGLLLIVGLFIWMGGKTANEKLQESLESNPLLKSCKYKHVYRGCGIGVDVEKKLVHLINNGFEKTYPFTAIRNWRYNISSGGFAYGGGLAVAGHNLRQSKENVAASGLFIEVKDIDHPEWQIIFSIDEKLEHELKRWMEILRQHINAE